MSTPHFRHLNEFEVHVRTKGISLIYVAAKDKDAVTDIASVYGWHVVRIAYTGKTVIVKEV